MSDWLIGDKRQRHQLSSCEGKQSFGSYAEAERHLGHYKNRKHKKKALNIYRCRHCSQWHTGTPPRPVQA